MSQLIVHADDFALTKSINEGILHAHTTGILTSASVMATGSAFEHAIGIYESAPNLDLGVHLTLVEEKPVLSRVYIPTLLDKNGKFHHHAAEFTKKYLMGKICLREVRKELEAQINKVRRHGVEITHLDSHQHLHMLPKIFKLTVELAKEFAVPAIRFPYEALRAYMFKEKNYFSRLFQLLVLNLLCQFANYKNSLRTDYFFGFFFGGNLNKKNLHKMLMSLPKSGTCELMCHPGFDDFDSGYNHWKYNWRDELNALIDSETSDLIWKKGIELISYRHLIQSA